MDFEPRSEGDVKRIAEVLDASATVRIVIYMAGIIFAAALVVWQVRSLAAGQEEIRKDMKLLTDPETGLMLQFSKLKTALDLRIVQADKDHARYDAYGRQIQVLQVKVGIVNSN